MKKILHLISLHKASLSQGSFWRIQARVFIESTLVPKGLVLLCLGILLAFNDTTLGGGAQIKRFEKKHVVYVIFVLLMIAPIFETLLFQSLPITCCNFLFKRNKYKDVISLLSGTVPFALVHFYYLSWVAFLGSLWGGYYFSQLCSIGIKKSFTAGFVNPAIAHMLRNLIAVLLYLAILYYR